VGAAFHEHRVMMLAGKACTRKGDKIRLHTRGGLGGDGQQFRCWGTLGQRRGILVRFDHRAEAVLTPRGDDQVGAGADHAGHAHHQRPGQGDHADQVVQVQPAQAGGFVLAHSGELQSAHKRQVQHCAGDDRQHKQHAHERQQQLARQPGEHVHMQTQQEQRETAIGRRHLHRLAGARVEHKGVGRIGLSARSSGHDRDHTVLVVLVPRQVLHGFTGAMGLRLGDQLLKVELRRIGRHLR